MKNFRWVLPDDSLRKTVTTNKLFTLWIVVGLLALANALIFGSLMVNHIIKDEFAHTLLYIVAFFFSAGIIHLVYILPPKVRMNIWAKKASQHYEIFNELLKENDIQNVTLTGNSFKILLTKGKIEINQWIIAIHVYNERDLYVVAIQSLEKQAKPDDRRGN
jgi:hypothetical protein